MTLKNTKTISILTIIAVVGIITSVSVVGALTVCESPGCLKIQHDEDTYKLTGDALREYHDINGRQIDFIALKEQLRYLPTNTPPIYIVVEGGKDSVSKFISEYGLDVELGKSTDNYIAQAGTINLISLQKYYDTVSFDDFVESDIHIAHAGGYQTDDGKIGNGPLPLTLGQQNSIGLMTDSFADDKISEMIRTSSDVEKVQ